LRTKTVRLIRLAKEGLIHRNIGAKGRVLTVHHG